MNSTTTPSTKNHRARWAAIGAAVAVTLGAGGLGIAQATSPDGASAFVPINPCRLADTRPGADNVGPKATPIGAGETWTLDGWGDVAGPCNLPTGTNGLELNVTSLDASQPTFLTVFPAGTAMPTASHLNPVPGEPPTPNSVSVSLAADGKFSVFNAFGTVNAIIDVVGYYSDHQHTGDDIVDESLTGADILNESVAGADILNESVAGADIQNNSVQAVDIAAEAGVAFAALNPTDFALDADQSIASVKVGVPANGYVTAIAEIGWFASNGAAADRTRCQLTKAETFDAALPWFRLNDIYPATDTGFLQTTTGQRTFAVSAADNTGNILTGIGQNIHVVCEQDTGTVTIGTVNLSVMYFPTGYNAGPLVLIPFSEQPEG